MYLGISSVNCIIGLYEPNGTRSIAINGQTKSNSQFTAYCSASSGYIRALSTGTYCVLFLGMDGSITYTKKSVSANSNIWSYSSRPNACVTVYKID